MSSNDKTSFEVPNKLLATGGIRTRTDGRVVERPILHWFPGSFNSGKATLAMQISQISDEYTSKLVMHMKDNYTPNYVRLNPDTCAVPTLEIDDQIITDSFEICQYLLHNYPGEGDSKVDNKEDMMKWILFCNAWDEYQYTYGHIPTQQAIMANDVRIYNLRSNLRQVLKTKNEEDLQLVDAYIQKIAGVTTMRNAMEDGPTKQTALEQNITQLHTILKRANDMISGNPHQTYLFGDDITTGDVYFLAILRIFHLLPFGIQLKDDDLWNQYPSLKGYWENATQNRNVQIGLLNCVKPSHMLWTMVSHGVPVMLLSYKLGFMSRPPKLPVDIEDRIKAACEESWNKAFG